MSGVSLLKVVLAGEVVAEATLTVHDDGKAWGAFLNGYPQIAHLIAGEVFQTMRTACDAELRARTAETGITIDLELPR